MAKSGILDPGKNSRLFRFKIIFPKKHFYDIFWAVSCHDFSVPIFSVPCRAKIFRAMIFRAGPCHKSAGPPCRAVPGRPWQKSTWEFCGTSIGDYLRLEFNGSVCIFIELLEWSESWWS